MSDAMKMTTEAPNAPAETAKGKPPAIKPRSAEGFAYMLTLADAIGEGRATVKAVNDAAKPVKENLRGFLRIVLRHVEAGGFVPDGVEMALQMFFPASVWNKDTVTAMAKRIGVLRSSWTQVRKAAAEPRDKGLAEAARILKSATTGKDASPAFRDGLREGLRKALATLDKMDAGR